MSGRDGGKGNADDAELSERLRKLDTALAQRRVGDQADVVRDQRAKSDATGFAFAVRLGSEFAAANVVGAGLGWFFDRSLGTSPWGLVVFLLLGFAAGVITVMRSAGLMKSPPGLSGGGDHANGS